MTNEHIHEGLVEIEIPKFDKVSSEAPVFYNPVMELNRDLSILALQEFQRELNKEIYLCDAFGGSGIRGIRYAKEISNVAKVVINDISSLAVNFQKTNIKLNGLDNVETSQNDASLMLREMRGEFDIVDIDPFGTPSYFTDSAAYSLKSDGMLCISATDTSALCGTYKAPCIRKYNAKPFKSEYCHENGVRILIGFVAMTFAKYKKYIEVKFSHSTEHYMRAYIKIHRGSKATDESLENMGFIVHCKKCLHRKTINGLAPHIPEVCPVCGEKLITAGPLWLGDIQNKSYIQGMIDSTNEKKLNKKDEALKLLNLCLNEADMPATFYDLHLICKKLRISAVRLAKVVDALTNEGFKVSRTHYEPTAIKTDASLDKIEEIIVKLNPES